MLPGLFDRVQAWRRDAVLYVRQCLNAHPDSWQVITLRKIQARPRVAMKASKGPGKSTVLAWACLWFLTCFPYPKIVVTSITEMNLRDGLWAELSKWIGKSELLQSLFTWTAERVFAKEAPADWWISARTWPKGGNSHSQAETLAGVHADNVMFVIDEAGGVPEAVAAAAEGGLANADETQGRTAKFLLAGNPTHLEGPLYRACTHERTLWEVIEISGDPDDPNRAPRVSIAWAREMIFKWGRDHDFVRVGVFGKFPRRGGNMLLGPDEVEAAQRRNPARHIYEHEVKILGVDVAREGDDRTVILLRQGPIAFMPLILRVQDAMHIAGQVARIWKKFKPDACFVDKADFGVTDRLNQLGFPAQRFNFGGPDYEPDYFNARAGMYFRMARWVRDVGALPTMAEWAQELCAVKYEFAADNQMKLEKKKEIKKRTGVSPDVADALALTFAQPVASQAVREALGAAATGTAADFDPY